MCAAERVLADLEAAHSAGVARRLSRCVGAHKAAVVCGLETARQQKELRRPIVARLRDPTLAVRLERPRSERLLVGGSDSARSRSDVEKAERRATTVAARRAERRGDPLAPSFRLARTANSRLVTTRRWPMTSARSRGLDARASESLRVSWSMRIRASVSTKSSAAAPVG